MTLRIYLEASAHLFVELIRQQTDDLAELPDADSQVRVFIMKDEYERDTNKNVATRRLDDGSLYKMEIHISYPPHNQYHLLQEAGKVSIAVTPLDPDVHAPNIEVRIEYDPMEEPPELLPHFLALFEPMEKARGGVLLQLEKQCPLLAFYNTTEPEWDVASENWDIWFGYYHAVQGLLIKFTLEDLAAKVDYAPGTVRNKHSKWLKTWGKYVEKLEQK